MRGLVVLFGLIVAMNSFSAAIDPRFISDAFNTLFAAKTTDGLSVGTTNLYFTNTLARGAVSGSGAISYSSSTGVFSCAAASGSVAGCLSSTDWSTFNGKQAALSFGNLSTSTTGITITGGTGAVIGSGATVDIATADATHTGLLSSTDYAAFAAGGATPYKAPITLIAGDITAGYVDMAVKCKAASLILEVGGASAVAEGLDYSVSVVSNKTRITFLGDLVTGGTALIAGDKLYTQCVE